MDVYRLLLILLSGRTITGENCSIVTSGTSGINTIASHRLLGHVYKKASKTELSSCVSMCKSDPYCLSVNYDFISQRCELNNKNAHMAAGDLKRWQADSFYVYAERIPTKNPCSFTVCHNGGKCEFDEGGLTMWCRCRNGYKGPRCEECSNSPLGFQDGRIPNFAFTASSHRDTHQPHMARLDGHKSWMPLQNDTNSFLQIDLAPHRYIITKITVSGDVSGNFASPYKVKYKDYNGNWTVYGQEGFQTLFLGPSYPGGKKINILNTPIKSTVIRILPQGENPAFRLELYGCRLTE